MNQRILRDFFLRDVLEVAPALLGKKIVRRFPDGTIKKYQITETEAYRGIEDRACHASKGRTPRTEVMFQQGEPFTFILFTDNTGS
jgi:DNA-3-methyladenine glycosylase